MADFFPDIDPNPFPSSRFNFEAEVFGVLFLVSRDRIRNFDMTIEPAAFAEMNSRSSKKRDSSLVSNTRAWMPHSKKSPA